MEKENRLARRRLWEEKPGSNLSKRIQEEGERENGKVKVNKRDGNEWVKWVGGGLKKWVREKASAKGRHAHTEVSKNK